MSNASNADTKTDGGFNPLLVGFFCNWGTYLAADLAVGLV